MQIIFDEDIISALWTIDRNVYTLHGSTHQMEHNPLFYAVWISGMIYVKRLHGRQKNVYACQKWYEDVWDEELTYYPGHGVTTPAKAREYIDDIRITMKNAGVLADVLRRREEDKRYDLKQYMRDTFEMDLG